MAIQRETSTTELEAYNSTFWNLGFRWKWDDETYRELASLGESERIQHYIDRHQPHLLRAYDRDFLARLILENKARRDTAVPASGTIVELA